MKKANTLASILAIPIISISSGCSMINNDQIRIPNHKPYTFNAGDEKIKAYQNMFTNTHHGSHILIVTKKDGTKTTYIGSGPFGVPKLDYIENPKRKNINSLSEKQEKQKQKEYKKYLNILKTNMTNFKY